MRDDDRDAGEDHDQRTVRARPFRRHAVARQIARHEVQQPGHRRRAGEPQDRDRRQVVDACRSRCPGARARGRRARGRRPARRAGTPPAGISTAVTKLLAISITLMISAAVEQQLLGVPDPSRRRLLRCRWRRRGPAASRRRRSRIPTARAPASGTGSAPSQPSSAGCRAARTATPSSWRAAPDAATMSREAGADDDDVQRQVDDHDHRRPA